MRFMSFMHIGCICMSFFKVHWALREKHKKMPMDFVILKPFSLLEPSGLVKQEHL